ncbi:hypothetical protein [Endozoicomonas ascidiicola]|uniref:hypothetical protein n=1 Tax=Endozoicomonas ascidiicola TaxID=1698521 RepID=UPI0008363754|nr:hypothetical protein [Endozoicomonas ascidiicola]
MSTKTYAVLGGEKAAPPSAQALVTLLATAMESAGYTLHTGGDAQGEEASAMEATKVKKTFLPWAKFNPAIKGTPYDVEVAEATVAYFHPLGEEVEPSTVAMLRKVAPVLTGAKCDKATPVEFLVYYGSGDQYDDKGVRYDTYGGLGQAVRICYKLGIPTFNIEKAVDRTALMVKVRECLGLPAIEFAEVFSTEKRDPGKKVKLDW